MTMRAFIAALLLTLCGAMTASAQIFPAPKHITPSRNALSLELGGVGEFYSLNYERRLNSGLLARVGGTHWSIAPIVGQERERMNALILGGSWLYNISPIFVRTRIARRRDIYLEASGDVVAGARSIYDTFQQRQTYAGSFLRFVPAIGMRIHPYGRGFILRGTIGRVFSLKSEAAYPRYRPPGVIGMSVGYAFY